MCQSREQLIRETRVLFRELILENKVYGRLYRHYNTRSIYFNCLTFLGYHITNFVWFLELITLSKSLHIHA